MNIYLLRHFKVQDNSNSWLNSEEFNCWVDTYDTLPLTEIEVELPETLDLILCSTLSRAKRTANSITNQEIIYSDKLIEVGSRVFFSTKFKLQKYIWFTMGSIMWQFNRLAGENRVDTLARANALLEEIKSYNKEHVLLISHGFFMKVFTDVLKEKGFSGTIEFRPKNAKLYHFYK